MYRLVKCIKASYVDSIHGIDVFRGAIARVPAVFASGLREKIKLSLNLLASFLVPTGGFWWHVVTQKVRFQVQELCH